jgi:hypothetical protein
LRKGVLKRAGYSVELMDGNIQPTVQNLRAVQSVQPLSIQLYFWDVVADRVSARPADDEPDKTYLRHSTMNSSKGV